MSTEISRSTPDLEPLPPGVVRDSETSPEASKSQEERNAAQQITQDNNPAETWEERMMRERGPRVSMNTPERRLETPQIDGYHLHWFLESNIPKAMAAWYEFVDPREVPTKDRSIGGRPPGVNTEDLGGARISQIAGQGADGRPEVIVLMKVKQELYFEDQRKIAERNLTIIRQIFRKKMPMKAPQESEADYQSRYTREAVIDMSNGRFRKV